MPLAKSNSKPKPSKPVSKPYYSFSFEAIGTSWWIGIYEAISLKSRAALENTIKLRIESFDKTYSRFRADSLVSAIAKKAGTYQLPPDAKQLLMFYRQLYDATDGLVTPLIGKLLSDAGYDSKYSFQPKKMSKAPVWDKAMEYKDGMLTTNIPLVIDFGAAGKGYLVDIIGDIIRSAKISAYCIDASGDIMFRHPNRSISVGLEHPDDSSQIIGIARLINQSLCGSATNRRKWANYHHIINPDNLRPVDTIKAVWVASSSTMLADGLSTALFFTDPFKLSAIFSFTHVVILANNVVQYSTDFPGEIFI